MIRFFTLLTIGVMSRLIPHLPNATLLTAFCVFAPSVLSKKQSVMLILGVLLLSDLLLGLSSSPAFGTWCLFTYSGWLMAALIGFSDKNKLGLAIGISLLFWLWTNLGTWGTTDLYPHTLSGLWACYAAAWPFLRNQVVGDVILMIIAFLMLQLKVSKIFIIYQCFYEFFLELPKM